MKFNKSLAGTFFICTVFSSAISGLAVAQVSIPTPPVMKPVQSEPRPEADIIYKENTLDKTFSSEVDFDYADIQVTETPMAMTDPEVDVAAAEMDADQGKQENTKKEEADSGGYTQAEINEMINNPLGKLWILMIQNDYTSYGGDLLDRSDMDNVEQNTMLIQPVMPFQLTDNWKVIFRPVIPINSYKTVEGYEIDNNVGNPDKPVLSSVDFDRKNGLGDIVLWTAFATNEMAKPPNVFGVGTTVMLDTASDDKLGTGQNSVGPMALAFHIDEKWIYGTVVQHWWSVNENSNRNRVNLTDIQYVGRYRYSPDTNIGFAPNIRYNWEADGSDRWTIPVGIGADTMIKMGPLPVKIGLEVYHYIKQPDEFGPEWQVRLFFTPVVPAPTWTQKALF